MLDISHWFRPRLDLIKVPVITDDLLAGFLPSLHRFERSCLRLHILSTFRRFKYSSILEAGPGALLCTVIRHLASFNNYQAGLELLMI